MRSNGYGEYLMRCVEEGDFGNPGTLKAVGEVDSRFRRPYALRCS